MKQKRRKKQITTKRTTTNKGIKEQEGSEATGES